MTYFLLRDLNILSKRELHLSLWVDYVLIAGRVLQGGLDPRCGALLLRGLAVTSEIDPKGPSTIMVYA